MKICAPFLRRAASDYKRVWYTGNMKGKIICFEALYEAYAVEIRRFIFVEVRKNPDLTEDIFQSTWENALRYLHTLKDPEKGRAWLYAIARNEAKRHFHNRKIRLFDASLLTGEEEVLDAPDPTSEDFPEALANTDLLSNLMSRLSEEEQQLILLHYYYDMSLKDIAVMGRANYNTVKSLTRRAIQKLKRFAEDMENS
jgi:RNA polymerase sigma-70 factor (ECF subfamily)